MPEVALFTVVALWASTFVVTKNLFATVSPLAFTGVRFVLMIGLSFGVLFVRSAAARRRGQAFAASIRRRDLVRFAGAGLTGYTLYQLCFVLGLDRTSPFSSSLLIALVPVFTVLLLRTLGERTPALGWFGLAIALAGTAFFLLDKRGASAGTLLGDALSLGAAISFATYGVVSRPLTAAYPPETATAFGLLIGGVPLLVVCPPAMATQNWTALDAGEWFAICYMAVFPVYVAYMLWNFGIARRGAVAATGYSLLVPIASGALSAAAFDEGFGPLKLLGAALTLIGLTVTRLGPRSRTDSE